MIPPKPVELSRGSPPAIEFIIAIDGWNMSLSVTPVWPEGPKQKSNNERACKSEFSIGVAFDHRAKHPEPAEP